MRQKIRAVAQLPAMRAMLRFFDSFYFSIAYGVLALLSSFLGLEIAYFAITAVTVIFTCIFSRDSKPLLTPVFMAVYGVSWVHTPQPPFSRSITVQVIPGPQEDRFSQRGLDAFYHSAFTVTDKSDRMGCRLSGPKIEHSGDPNIISDGIPLGAVQVPGSGEPMIMMSEHQGSGGYAKIANVISVDIPLVAQCPPGAEIRFQAVTVEEAQRLYLAQLAEYGRLEQMFRQELAGRYQVTVNGRTFQVEVTAAW